MTVNLDRLIFFDCFSERAHLRRPGQLIRSTRGADQGSVDRQDHGRESCVSRHARAGPLARRAGALARARVTGGEVLCCRRGSGKNRRTSRSSRRCHPLPRRRHDLLAGQRARRQHRCHGDAGLSTTPAVIRLAMPSPTAPECTPSPCLLPSARVTASGTAPRPSSIVARSGISRDILIHRRRRPDFLDDESFRRIGSLATDALWPYSAQDPADATEAFRASPVTMIHGRRCGLRARCHRSGPPRTAGGKRPGATVAMTL
jgi:hypothetical protein